MKKVFSFAEICAYALGVIGGFGWSAYGGSWDIAVAVLVLGAMALPEVKRAFYRLLDE